MAGRRRHAGVAEELLPDARLAHGVHVQAQDGHRRHALHLLHLHRRPRERRACAQDQLQQLPQGETERILQVGSEALHEQSIKLVDEFTYSVIRRRKAEIMQAWASGKQEKIKHNILSRFIELGEASGDDGGSLFGDDKGLRDVVLNFVIAGRDTTATTLSWFTYMAMAHPDVAEKLRRELTAFESERAREEGVALVPCNDDEGSDEAFAARMAQFAGLLSYDGLGKLVYLHACVTETMRLYPAVPQDPKGIAEDDVLPDGTKVRAGGMVTYVPYSMGRMEYNWGPDAARGWRKGAERRKGEDGGREQNGNRGEDGGREQNGNRGELQESSEFNSGEGVVQVDCTEGQEALCKTAGADWSDLQAATC